MSLHYRIPRRGVARTTEDYHRFWQEGEWTSSSILGEAASFTFLWLPSNASNNPGVEAKNDTRCQRTAELDYRQFVLSEQWRRDIHTGILRFFAAYDHRSTVSPRHLKGKPLEDSNRVYMVELARVEVDHVYRPMLNRSAVLSQADMQVRAAIRWQYASLLKKRLQLKQPNQQPQPRRPYNPFHPISFRPEEEELDATYWDAILCSWERLSDARVLRFYPHPEVYYNKHYPGEPVNPRIFGERKVGSLCGPTNALLVHQNIWGLFARGILVVVPAERSDTAAADDADDDADGDARDGSDNDGDDAYVVRIMDPDHPMLTQHVFPSDAHASEDDSGKPYVGKGKGKQRADPPPARTTLRFSELGNRRLVFWTTSTFRPEPAFLFWHFATAMVKTMWAYTTPPENPACPSSDNTPPEAARMTRYHSLWERVWPIRSSGLYLTTGTMLAFAHVLGPEFEDILSRGNANAFYPDLSKVTPTVPDRNRDDDAIHWAPIIILANEIHGRVPVRTHASHVLFSNDEKGALQKQEQEEEEDRAGCDICRQKCPIFVGKLTEAQRERIRQATAKGQNREKRLILGSSERGRKEEEEVDVMQVDDYDEQQPAPTMWFGRYLRPPSPQQNNDESRQEEEDRQDDKQDDETMDGWTSDPSNPS